MALVRVCGAVRRGVQTCGMRTVHCVCVELGTQPEHSTNPRHVLGWRGVATDCKEGITRGHYIGGKGAKDGNGPARDRLGTWCSFVPRGARIRPEFISSGQH